MNLVHASPVAGLLSPGALVHVCLAHPVQSKTLPALSSSSPRARSLASSHGVSPLQEASKQIASINTSIREVRTKG
jgi:hypothetical protein